MMLSDWTAPPGYFHDTRDVKGVFETIYARDLWGGGSGRGSDPEAAQPYMELLQTFLNGNPIRTVVDIGCGDWQFSQFIDWGGRSYLGIDVVESVVRVNTESFARSNISFRCTNPLDPGFDIGGDLLLMKDVLQHLSSENVRNLLGLAKRFKYALITNDYAPENRDCNNGDTRSLDIRAEPFNLREATVIATCYPKAVFLVTNCELARR